MAINFISNYSKFSGMELEWLPSDTKSLFESNIKDRFDDLEKFGWLSKRISYKFNSQGFRCEEFTDKGTAMFLGCSNTMGIGIPFDETWAYIVAKNLKLQNANLGLGAGASDTAFRMCLGYIDSIKPKIVIYNQPPPSRLEIMYNDSFQVILPNIKCSYSSDEFIKKFWLHEDNSELNRLKNMLSIKFMCSQRNIKFIYTENYMEPLNGTCDDLARDLAHKGTNYNRVFANLVLAKI